MNQPHKQQHARNATDVAGRNYGYNQVMNAIHRAGGNSATSQHGFNAGKGAPQRHPAVMRGNRRGS